MLFELYLECLKVTRGQLDNPLAGKVNERIMAEWDFGVRSRAGRGHDNGMNDISRRRVSQGNLQLYLRVVSGKESGWLQLAPWVCYISSGRDCLGVMIILFDP